MPDLLAVDAPDLGTVPVFMEQLENSRATATPAAWKENVRSDQSLKAWRYFLSLDPYTRWGLVKPRGYAGDATLMDFAYKHSSVSRHVDNAGSLGKSLYEITAAAPQSQSARQRIQVMRDLITQMVTGEPALRIVSFAAGHARELERLDPDVRSRIARYTAIDVDPISLREAASSAGAIAFTGHNANVIRDDLSHVELGTLVYSLGLFDYLRDNIAEKVLEKMLSVTELPGRCVVANLAPDAANLGYCEAIMDWWMITRSADDLVRLGVSATAELSCRSQVSVTRHGCFNYLSIEIS